MTSESSIVDVHAHALTESFLSVVATAIPELGTTLVRSGEEVYLALTDGSRRGPFPRAFTDPEPRLEVMADSGVGVHVLSSPPFMFLYEHPVERAAPAITELNDSYVEWAHRWPGSYLALASLPLQSVDAAVAEIERIKPEASVVGVAIGSNVAGTDLDDERFEPLWDALVAANLPVLIHPVDAPGSRLRRYFLRNSVGNPVDTTIAAACLIFGGVLARHPGLRVCLVHGGGFLPYQLGRLEQAYLHRPEARAGLPSAPSSYFHQLWFDTIVHDLPALRFAGEQMGWDRWMVGTDYPFEMGDLTPRVTIEALGLADDQLLKVRRTNAMQFLRKA